MGNVACNVEYPVKILALRGHQAALDGTKSPERETADFLWRMVIFEELIRKEQ